MTQGNTAASKANRSSRAALHNIANNSIETSTKIKKTI